MKAGWMLLAIVLAMLLPSNMADSLTNSWAVEVRGGLEAAEKMAAKYGFINRGQVANLENMYHFELPEHSVASKKSLNGLPVYELSDAMKSEPNVGYVKRQVARKMVKKSFTVPNDPRWNDQWQLLNTGQLNVSDRGRDHNIERAWLQGVTGCGVTVAVVDDGVEYTHPDLRDNYDFSLQSDVVDNDGDPFPIVTGGVRESHGTSCAGEIAMVKNNNNCGVGVAFNSKITGVRLLVPFQTDIMDANALATRPERVVVSSNSWGPSDIGFVIQGPGPLTQMVLESSTSTGRQGRGTIYLFAAGNGGPYDSCAFDGFATNVYTIGIGSANSDGSQSFYDENCAGKMATIFTFDPFAADRELARHVTTTGPDGSCISNFDGTSASTPLASGIVALALEANEDLSWRDVQYLIVYTSRRDQLVDGDWITNGAGVMFSYKFGFGALDAEAMVSRARHWITVPEQRIVDSGSVLPATRIEPGGVSSVPVAVATSEVVFLEHVVLTVSLSFPDVPEPDYYYYGNTTETAEPGAYRGNIQIELTSPSGSTSIMMPFRITDINSLPVDEFPFTSLVNWGENPNGQWTITIRNTNTFSSAAIVVTVNSLRLYGTAQTPAAVSRIPAQCHASCDPARSCAAAGPEFCDACAALRNATSPYLCLDSCEGLAERNGYCYDDSVEEARCAGVITSSHALLVALLLLATLLYN